MNGFLHKKIKYPKLMLFIITVVAVYFLFSGLLYEPLHETLLFLGYFGTFLAGLLYPYAFTSAAGTAILLILAKGQNLLLAGVIAGFGAFISDIVIFFFVKRGFGDEVEKLSKEPAVQAVSRRIPDSVRTYLFGTLACFFIASPLPTEIGVMMMTSMRNMSTRKFAVIVDILHLSAIFIILLIGKTI